MGNRINYTMVGLFVVILTIALIVIGLWLYNSRDKKFYDFYTVYMNESVSGLSIHSQVDFNGVTVGYVKSIKLNYADPQQVDLILAIERGVPITTSTVATLRTQGLTGLTYVSLTAKTSTAELLAATNKPPYPIIKSGPSLFMRLDTIMAEATNGIKVLTANVSELINQKNVKTFDEILQNTKAVTQTLAENANQIKSSITAANTFFNNSATASRKFPALVEQMQTATAALDKAGQSTTSTMQAGHVAIENVMQQTLPSMSEALSRLNDILNNVQNISQKVQHNPAILIRGELPAPQLPGDLK